MNALPDCEGLRDLIPAYAIGATDADETRQIEAALPRCPDLAAELAAYTAVRTALAQSVPRRSPPPALLDALLTAAETHRPRPTRPAAAWLAAACLLVLLFANNAWWLARSSAPTVRQLALPAADAASAAASARVVWSAADEQAVLVAAAFPPLAADTVYQAWVRRGETVTSLGVFRVDARGQGALTFPAALLADDFDGVGVTAEPAGGSPAPTGSPVVRWRRT